MKAGLRIDVDTLRGTRLGVPRLLATLRRYGVKATFFFSVGPDNMGKHLWRLLNPVFFWKMLRTNAPNLYGWSILRCGVIGQGPDIGLACGDIIRAAAAEGHEIGLHAWDHQHWQSMDLDDFDSVSKEIALGLERFEKIAGFVPSCSAAPAWRANATVVAAKQRFPFVYNSDSRGRSCFIPVDSGEVFQPQAPVTLPTYDELYGTNGVTDDNYNERLLDLFQADSLNVLCIHAEVEGVAKADLFEKFMETAVQRGIAFERLETMLKNQSAIHKAKIKVDSLPGRQGKMFLQGETVR